MVTSYKLGINFSRYPPSAIPAIAFGSITGNSQPEMVFSFSDGTISCYNASGVWKWTYNFASYLGINPQVSKL